MNKFIFTLSNEEMAKINIVDLEKLYNFVVQNLFDLNFFRASKFDLKFSLPSIFFTRQRKSLPSVKKTLSKEGSLPSAKKTLGTEGLCQVFFGTRQRILFAECFPFGTWRRSSLPSARKKYSANH